jgi:hypothetical protein
MMKMKKIFAISIIFLFIGVAVAPSINFNVVKASNDNDLVEVTTQACGIKGFEDTTVKLTRQQYQNLEQYLVEFEARLNKTTTREEAVPIFKEAVVELNKYRLLPKGMSVERAQRLVTGLHQNTKLVKYVEKLSNKSEKSSLQEGNELCSIYGEAQGNTYFQGPVSKAIYNVLNKLLSISFTYSLFDIFTVLIFIPLLIHVYMTLTLSENLRDLPYIGAIIYYGKSEWYFMQKPHYYPADGNIWTNGLLGIKNWSGQFYGRLPSPRLEGLFSQFYPGVNGFTGLRLYLNQTDFYFGFALNVNVGP